MFLKASKFFIYCAVASPLIVNRNFFFPFITPKGLFFRISIEVALLTFGAGILMGEITTEYIKTKLRDPLFITVAVFTALFLTTCLTAINPSFAFWSNFERGEGGWQILHYFLFFTLITLLFSSEKDWRRLIGWQALVSALVGLYAIGQAYNWSWIIDPPTGALSGTLGNPSYLGSYMLLSSFLTLYLASQKSGLMQWFWLSITLFQFIIFITAKTRGSFAALGAGIILMAIFWIFKNKNNKKVWITGAVFILAIFLGTTALINTIKGRDAWKNVQPRLWTWSTAAAGIAEKPLTGWGIENFPFIFDKYYNPNHDGIESWFDRAHNALLEYATSGGILLLTAYIAIFYLLYRRLAQTPKTNSWPLVAALPLMYLVNGLVLFEILPLYLMLFLFLAFTNGYTNQFSEPQKQHNKHTIPRIYAYMTLIPLTAIMISALYYTAYLPFKKNRLMLAALETNNRADEEIFKDHEKALAFSSPIGQQEAVQNLLAFTVDYFNYLQQSNFTERVSKEKRQQIIDLAARWYEREKSNAIGVRTLYLYAVTLLTEMKTTGNREYRARMDALIKEGAEKAPTRLEFVRLELESAALQKDKARYERAAEKGKRLRPDLNFNQEVRVSNTNS